MKIAFLSAFYPFRGGIAQFNAALYRELEKEHEVKAFTFKRQYPNILFPGSSQYVEKEDKADCISSIEILDTINPISYFTTTQKIKHYAPDLLIMKYWMPFFAPSLGTVARSIKNTSKVVSILDNIIPHEKRVGDIALNKFFLNQNDGFIVMSDAVKKDLLTLKPNAKYLFHPHPLYNHFGEKIDKQKARKLLQISSEKKVLLFFGFIRDYKGLNILIDAMKTMPNDYLLLVAGEVYGSFEGYEKQIVANNLQNKVHLNVRYISDHEVSTFFSASDVCVLPYKSATQSGIVAIANHFETPVIATSVGGLAESVIHNQTGLIVERPETALIEESINTFFSKHVSENFTEAIKKMKKNLSWKHFADELLGFCKTL